MTLDEAIKYVEEMVEIGETYEVGKVVEENRQLLEWLKELKQLREQEPCEDAISRQEVLEYIEGSEAELGHSSENELVCKYIKELSSVKPVNPKQKIGHWIKYSTPRCGEQHYQCTSCKYYINFGRWGELYTKEFKYCPNCSAKMVEPQENEE